MSSINVSVVPVHGLRILWMIKRVASGTPWLGWAKFDGTFSPGMNANAEAMDPNVVSAPYAEDAVEFAQGQGWNVVSIIDR